MTKNVSKENAKKLGSKGGRCAFELDGKVYFVQYSGNKEVSREEIDGNLVLQLLHHALQQGIKAKEVSK